MKIQNSVESLEHIHSEMAAQTLCSAVDDFHMHGQVAQFQIAETEPGNTITAFRTVPSPTPLIRLVPNCFIEPCR